MPSAWKSDSAVGGITAAFATSVAGVTARRWGKAADAAGADLAGLWADGAAQGWFALGAGND